jgi:phosphatidylserine/phosphatidylglycerophosphate/cardiolipin synthase-like enzyme
MIGMGGIRAYANCDHTYVVWQTETHIPGCRGFALHRKAGGNETLLETWVGFAGDTAPEGMRKPSTEWPIQKFMWSDYDPPKDMPVIYRAVPMVGAKDALQPDETNATGWSEPVTTSANADPGLAAYFNRGVVASQWLARRLKALGGSPATDLQHAIGTEGNVIRELLAGAVLEELPELLAEAHTNGTEIYAALYELDDPELIKGLTRLGGSAHVVLANGAQTPDGNHESRAELKAAGVDVHDRLVSSAHFAHNKFLVLTDKNGAPQRVWTGSTNWTKTGLCTQANNALLIEDPTIADWYKQTWEAIATAGNDYPEALFETDDQKRSTNLATVKTSVWFAPVHGQIDLIDARAHIDAATHGILFLMFNPGPTGTLLNAIVERTTEGTAAYDPTLYVHGVLNQDPATTAHPIVGLFHHGQFSEADVDVILPANVETGFAYWIREILKLPTAHAIVHSKTIVIDPFGENPIVMTGSHNMGPKASGKNDDNLAIIQGAPKLAAAYAVNIMSIYNQYRWRYRQKEAANGKQPVVTAPAHSEQDPGWAGLQDSDTWQDEYLSGMKKHELDFWMGT